jgi:putative chitinase
MNPFILTNSDLFYTVFTKYGIVTPLRMAHFLAQIHNETGGFIRFSENLNYSSAGLLETFPSRITVAEANLYGRNNLHKANAQAIANIVYGGNWGRINLGNIQKGDGYRFRGRGFLQLTGRANYEAYKKYSGLDVVSNPDLVSSLAVGLDVAGWFWSKRGVNGLADKNDIVAVTKKVNGGQIGITKRKQFLAFYLGQNMNIESLKKKPIS